MRTGLVHATKIKSSFRATQSHTLKTDPEELVSEHVHYRDTTVVKTRVSAQGRVFQRREMDNTTHHNLAPCLLRRNINGVSKQQHGLLWQQNKTSEVGGTQNVFHLTVTQTCSVQNDSPRTGGRELTHRPEYCVPPRSAST